jgi:hypothetical protein
VVLLNPPAHNRLNDLNFRNIGSPFSSLARVLRRAKVTTTVASAQIIGRLFIAAKPISSLGAGTTGTITLGDLIGKFSMSEIA